MRANGRPVNIVDVAAGHGRYIIETVASNRANADHVLLRDYSDRNVEPGLSLIRQKGLESIATFEKGNAFDRQSLATIQPRPTLGVVSGLYELFPDNSLIRQSLAGLAEAVAPGGYLIYTGQPWHPQLERIARVLSSHRDHKPWIMIRRSQNEMDQLVETSGFKKIDQITEDWGIFTVSLAQRCDGFNADGNRV